MLSFRLIKAALVVFVVVFELWLSLGSVFAQGPDVHGHAHTYQGAGLVLDASYFGQEHGLDFHHTHFNQDKEFVSASDQFRNFCRDRIDGQVPNKDYSELFSRLKAVVGYFEGQGYKDIKVNVVSCFRSAKSNGVIRANSIARNGGRTGVAKRSQHTYGTAMDFYLSSNGQMISISKTVDVMCALARRTGNGGVGKYAGWVHADTREGIAQWGGANCRNNPSVDALLGGGVQG